MNKKITLCIPTLNRYDLLDACIDSARKGSIKPNIFLIDNGGILPKNIKKKCDEILTPVVNLGVAKSWNWFLDVADYPMVIANDDILFGRYDLENFHTSFYTYKEIDLFYTNNITATLNMFSCFMPTPRLISRVGKFDEEFYPAYYEDNDFWYRMSLMNCKIKDVDTDLTHFGSATIKSYDENKMNEHHTFFRKNSDYYIKKWGGLPGNELYKIPFGE